MVHAASGRCSGLHYGTYDYSAFCGIAARYQSLDHPAADHAKAVMQAAAAGTGVRLSDGSTNVVPADDTTAEVHRTWRTHADLVRHSLSNGYYQGWDMHAAHLPSRFATVFAFHLDGIDDTIARLRAAHDGGDAVAGVMDEPATVKTLTDRLRKAVDCGALDDTDVKDLLT
jgi:hypothetical protein